jgi:competence protein ComEA
MSDLQPGPSSFLSSPPSWAARFAVLRTFVTPGRVVLAVAATAAAVAFGLVFLRTPSRPPELVLPKVGDAPPVTGPPAPGTGSGSTPAAGGLTSLGPGGVGVVTAHAAGQVKAPGVYSVPAGARVADLVTAAGGLLPEADLDRLNLAAKVVDGTRVYIPRKGESPPPEAVVGDPAAGPPAAAGGGGAGAPAGPIDLNTATVAQLDTLPGVGPATANAIITYRTRNGRFKSVTELLEVPGIGPAKLESIRPLVVVS